MLKHCSFVGLAFASCSVQDGGCRNYRLGSTLTEHRFLGGVVSRSIQLPAKKLHVTVYRYLTWECSGLARSDEWKNDQDLALAQMSISKLITCAYEATSLLYDLGEFLFPCQFLDPAAMKNMDSGRLCVAVDPHRWMSGSCSTISFVYCFEHSAW